MEERFQKARGTGLFLMSPLDWALVETWKNAGVPLEAALRGIDAAFEKWRTKKKRGQNVNSVAYCSQAVLAGGSGHGWRGAGARPQRIRRAVQPGSIWNDTSATTPRQIRKQPGFDDIAAAVDRLASEAAALFHDLEDLEQRLTALEDKMIALARSRQTEEDLLACPPRTRSSASPVSRKNDRTATCHA